MKKRSLGMLIAILLTAVFWLLTAAFALGTNVSPRSYWLPSPMRVEGTDKTMNAGVTIDLDRTLTSPEGEGKTYDVSRIYVFIGRAYTSDEKGNVSVNFDFKTTSQATDEYLRRVTAEIPADHGNARYRYYKVFDAAEEGTDPLNYKRVKVNTAYSFEFYEVVFTDEKGRAFAIENAVVDETAYGDHATRFAAALTDEQRTFRSSGAGAYVLSERECDALAAADSLLTGSGYAVGSAPLSSLLNAAGVAIFGRNTFGIRFSAFLFGFLSLLAVANLAKKLFLKESFAVCAVVLAVAGGGLFAAAISSSPAVYAAFFLLMAISLAVSFFGNAYSFGNFRASSINVCLTGLFFGLSAACAPQTIFCFLAFALIYAVSLRRRYLEYKAEEKAASGLAKEDAYQRYRRSALGAGGSIAFGFVLIPFLVWLISFAIVSSDATAFYGKGFLETSSAMFGGAFVRAYRENPFLFLVGFGKENAGVGVLFFNKVVSIASLCGLLYTTAVVLIGGKCRRFAEERKRIRNKYRIVTFAFLASLLPLALGFQTGIADYALSSVLYAMYIPLAAAALKERKKAAIVSVCVSVAALIVFAAAYPGYCGFAVSSAWRALLFGWQAV